MSSLLQDLRLTAASVTAWAAAQRAKVEAAEKNQTPKTDREEKKKLQPQQNQKEKKEKKKAQPKEKKETTNTTITVDPEPIAIAPQPAAAAEISGASIERQISFLRSAYGVSEDIIALRVFPEAKIVAGFNRLIDIALSRPLGTTSEIQDYKSVHQHQRFGEVLSLVRRNPQILTSSKSYMALVAAVAKLRSADSDNHEFKDLHISGEALCVLADCTKTHQLLAELIRAEKIKEGDSPDKIIRDLAKDGLIALAKKEAKSEFPNFIMCADRRV